MWARSLVTKHSGEGMSAASVTLTRAAYSELQSVITTHPVGSTLVFEQTEDISPYDLNAQDLQMTGLDPTPPQSRVIVYMSGSLATNRYRQVNRDLVTRPCGSLAEGKAAQIPCQCLQTALRSTSRRNSDDDPRCQPSIWTKRNQVATLGSYCPWKGKERAHHGNPTTGSSPGPQ